MLFAWKKNYQIKITQIFNIFFKNNSSQFYIIKTIRIYYILFKRRKKNLINESLQLLSLKYWSKYFNKSRTEYFIFNRVYYIINNSFLHFHFLPIKSLSLDKILKKKKKKEKEEKRKESKSYNLRKYQIPGKTTIIFTPSPGRRGIY